MRKSLALLMFFYFFSGNAQDKSIVFLHNGSNYIGKLIKTDSLSGTIKLRTRGGSEIVFSFHEIDSIRSHKQRIKEHKGHPFFGIGLGLRTNQNSNLFQLDLSTGYQFSNKWQLGVGVGISDLGVYYLGLNYFPFRYKIFNFGIFTKAGVPLSPWNNYVYEGEPKTKGYYTCNGIAVKLPGYNYHNFIFHIGYQFSRYERTFPYYYGGSETRIYIINRYYVSGIYAF